MVGIVTSFNRPGGNVTGVGLLGSALETKRLELLHELVPGSTPIDVLVNPTNPAADLQLRELQEAAAVIKRQINIVRASTAPDIDAAFEIAAQQKAGALLVVQDPFYNSRREQLVALAARHKQPVIYPLREFTEIGGLFSYGHNLVDEYRQMGVYAGRISRVRSLPIFLWYSQQVRVRHQPKDSKDARPDYSSIAAYYRRRGDRITMLFAAVRQSAIGP